MKVYTIQINYKSGISMVSDFVSFSISGDTVMYDLFNLDCNVPILLNHDAIESVWTLSVREESPKWPYSKPWESLRL